MKAIKIDVVKREVSTVDIRCLVDICSEIEHQCEHFTCPLDLPNGDTLFVDDEALIKRDLQGCFMIKGFEKIIIGNAILVGIDENKDIQNVKSSIAGIKNKILWGSQDMAKKYQNMMKDEIRAIYLN